MNTLEYKGFQARIMRAEKLENNRIHGLPLGRPIECHEVDEFVEPLPHWLHGPGNFVIPVRSEWALWFDWTLNSSMNTAVLPTIKGMNPITGRKTEGFFLESYKEKCPTHGCELNSERYCKECDYKLAPQNYICAPNTLWWDGFRTQDGKVRQFFFTEDLQKSIPERVIGKENTIPAFGFAFYEPKKRRQDSSFYYNVTFFNSSSAGNIKSAWIKDGIRTFCDFSHSHSSNSITITSNGRIGIGNTNPSKELHVYDPENPSKELHIYDPERANKEVGLGAGAEIRQELYADNLNVTDWKNEPSAVMRLYFIFQEQFDVIKKKGMKRLDGKSEGFLEGLTIG